MDSEDDMNDGSNSDPEYDDFYHKNEDDDSDLMPTDDDDEDCAYGYADHVVDDFHIASRQPQKHYTVLDEAMILDRQKQAIENVATVLSISNMDAGTLLRHFKWSVSRLNDEWFANEQAVRNAIGLLEKPASEVGPVPKELVCGICFESHLRSQMKAPVCKHFFCVTCWTGD